MEAVTSHLWSTGHVYLPLKVCAYVFVNSIDNIQKQDESVWTVNKALRRFDRWHQTQDSPSIIVHIGDWISRHTTSTSVTYKFEMIYILN